MIYERLMMGGTAKEIIIICKKRDFTLIPFEGITIKCTYVNICVYFLKGYGKTARITANGVRDQSVIGRKCILHFKTVNYLRKSVGKGSNINHISIRSFKTLTKPQMRLARFGSMHVQSTLTGKVQKRLKVSSALLKIQTYDYEDTVFDYNSDDLIRYALSIGASLPDDFHFLFEGDSKFSVIPSFACLPGVDSIIKEFHKGIPGMEEVDLSRVLHGEQYLELFEPLPLKGKFTSRISVIDALDKRKFCQLILNNNIYDAHGDQVGFAQVIMLCLGSASIGHRGKCDEHILPVSSPRRPADATCEDKTSINQAALYRLNGDKNHLHIDPKVASAMGYKQSILHGLCSYGFSLRHILKTYCNNDCTAFKSMKARFVRPVVPGDTLVTEMWHEGSRILFQTKVKETGDTVLNGGFVDLHNNI